MRAGPSFHWLLSVLFLVATVLGGERASADDTLILTDDVKSGTLEGCSGGVCGFDGAAIPRASIYYIGLDAELPPPAPQDGTRDEVHLRDGSVHPGPLMSIDATNVVTAGAVHPRKLVAWIWLTPLTSGEGQGQAAPSTTTSDGEAENKKEEEWTYYQWEGTIRVENRFIDAKYGRHRWRAVYKVKLREENHGGPYLENGRMTHNIGLEPLEFDYEFDADQAWLVYPTADMVAKTITMSGHASGQLLGDDLSALNAHLWGLDAPYATPYQAPTAFASSDEVSEYFVAQNAGAAPGWYSMSLAFLGWGAEKRALYAGIERGGTLPIYDRDPDEAFLDAIPVCMPTPTMIEGRLDRPDQTEVRGDYTYLYRRSGDNAVQAPNEIALEWSFTRTRVPDQQ